MEFFYFTSLEAIKKHCSKARARLLARPDVDAARVRRGVDVLHHRRELAARPRVDEARHARARERAARVLPPRGPRELLDEEGEREGLSFIPDAARACSP